ncbi:MAG TPA: DMT family transporter [Candidatus Thermoplasmatota archaeon]|nr:DMT family transporter [Candidatus Thermoplasmatota archaeon]
MARPLRPADLGLLLALGAVWGTAFMFISLGLESFSPVLLAALRFDISGLTLLAVALALRRGQLVPRGRRQWAAVGIAGLCNVAAYHGFLFWGQQFTTASIAAVIVGLNPVLTTAFSRALLEDERVGAAGLAGLGLGFGGIVLLASLKPGSLLDARGLGELAVVAAIAAWAMGSVLVKRQKHGMDVFAFIAWHSFAGAAVLHVAALGLEGGGRATWDLPGLTSLFYLAVVSSGLGFIVYFTLLERIGPIRSNVVSYLAPVSATVAAFVVLGQPFEARAGLAYALIAAGFWLIARPARAPAEMGKEAAVLDVEEAP